MTTTETVYRLFDPCRENEHDDCAAELWVNHNDGRLGGHRVVCGCACHVPDSTDRLYAAQYAYACGSHD